MTYDIQENDFRYLILCLALRGSLTGKAKLAGHRELRICLSLPPSTGNMASVTNPVPNVGAEDSNSDTHVCTSTSTYWAISLQSHF